ncbi:hypothetical protein BL250_07200 [Erwinia sp. OLTSP20]|uniref:hypothetical protein n=1 Tax=unclassified Erwinia TaxID=2622719 RepID=UPI000C195412|nr:MULTISPECIES: hypothetical protein [unclassified Erwinia]PIJ50565.1 hypothetical protein BV501_08005 [Erwinia sp. OAMSP11]PIJ72883.1 hypothetical protein BK416_08280 [Erwinia sp. OLSSP12]PIJ82213.1 hypothetical protein BLD47_06740 [Erwinia sp. OLCASP19]PIJ84766.1 hypothetical protein BLD46_07135 [Erwinia sp. OLMTSP26]PIJ86731.1 hypothetical protein BLD49_07860 [Erwinia sp. OLMDSP33]
MSDENNLSPVVPFDTGIDLNQAQQQGKAVIQFMENAGIKEATFKTGMYYHHNESTGTSTVAADSIMMIQHEHTTQIIIRHPGSTPEQALAETNALSTQKAIGAFSGKSQPWVSTQNLPEKNSD